MKKFFQNIWKYISFILVGVLVGMRLKKAPEVVNVEKGDYIKDQETSIGKVKQRGRDNEQDISQEGDSGLSRKEIRQQRKAVRKAAKKGKRKEKQK